MIQVATNDGAIVLHEPEQGQCGCCGREPDGGVVGFDVTAVVEDPRTARVALCGDCVATALSVHLSALSLRPCPHRERQG